MSFKNSRRNSLICSSSPQISSDSPKVDSDNSDSVKSDISKNESSKWSDNLTDSDSLKLVITDSASIESDDKTAMTQTQDEDNISSANTVIMGLEDGQSDHELELADTQILSDTQVMTDYNDNTQIVIEPPKSPNQKHFSCSRRHSQSQLTKVSSKVTLHQSESIVVSQKMEKCFLSTCNDKVNPIRSGLKKSPSHKRKLLQSSEVLEDQVSTEKVPKKPKDESPDLLYPTPPEQNKRRRKTSEGVTQSQDCCPLCGKNMSFKALLKHSLLCNGGINTRAASSVSTKC